MGRDKHNLEQGYYSDLDTDVCSSCIEEVGIFKFICTNHDPSIKQCSYCSNTSNSEAFKACNLGLVVGHVFQSISEDWCNPAEVLPYESAEGGYQCETFDTHELLFYLSLNIDDENIIDCCG